MDVRNWMDLDAASGHVVVWVLYDELHVTAKFCISGFSRDMIVNH